jgi:hypothetical protein
VETWGVKYDKARIWVDGTEFRWIKEVAVA